MARTYVPEEQSTVDVDVDVVAASGAHARARRAGRCVTRPGRQLHLLALADPLRRSARR